MRRDEQRRTLAELVLASEIAAFVYCPEAWRFENRLECRVVCFERRIDANRFSAWMF